MHFEFQGWHPFHARKTGQLDRWLRDVAKFSERAFKRGMGHYPPASSEGDWPSIRSGRLRASIRTTVTASEVTISSNMPYSGYLREGTSKMGRRKMSDDALKEGMRSARLGKWVEWTYGSP